jgi:hypothetical protein
MMICIARGETARFGRKTSATDLKTGGFPGGASESSPTFSAALPSAPTIVCFGGNDAGVVDASFAAGFTSVFGS